jgi:hypothetical protein
MIADKPGRFELAPLHLAWWDTRANEAREVTLPARTLTILPAVGGGAAPASGASASPAAGAPAQAGRDRDAASGTSAGGRAGALRDPWAWTSIALANLWIGTMLAWFFTRRSARERAGPAPPVRKSAQLSASQARAQFQSACRRNDAQAARRTLIAWAATAWPEAPPQGLAALTRKLGDDKIGALLLGLGRALYRGAAWDGAALAAALRELPPSGSAASGGGRDGGGGLAPLYH